MGNVFRRLLRSAISLGGAVAVAASGSWIVALGVAVGSMAWSSLFRSRNMPEAAEQAGTQREMTLDPTAQVPVVYGRAIVAPRLVYVTTSGASNEKLYIVGVLSEGNCAAVAL